MGSGAGLGIGNGDGDGVGGFGGGAAGGGKAGGLIILERVEWLPSPPALPGCGSGGYLKI